MQPPATQQSTNNTLSRRRYLGGVAAASIPLLAGCTSLTEHEFTAQPVWMPSENAEALGFEELARGEWEVILESRAFAMDLTATIRNQYSVYGGLYEFEHVEESNSLSAGAMATPVATVWRESRNPVANLTYARFLTDEGTAWFLSQAGIEGIESGWYRLPSRVTSRRTDLFGGINMRLTTRAGVLNGDSEPMVVFAHISRHSFEADTVWGLVVRKWPVEDPELDYIGEEGYLTGDELEVEVLAAETILDNFRYGE